MKHLHLFHLDVNTRQSPSTTLTIFNWNPLTPPPTPDNQHSQLTGKSNQKTNWPVQQKADCPTTYLPVPGRDSRGNSVSTTLRWSVLWQLRNTLWTCTTSRWSVLRQLMNTMDLFVVMLVDLLSWNMLGQWLSLCEYFRVIYVSLFIRYFCLFSRSKPTLQLRTLPCSQIISNGRLTKVRLI